MDEYSRDELIAIIERAHNAMKLCLELAAQNKNLTPAFAELQGAINETSAVIE